METLAPKNHFEPEKQTFVYLAEVALIGGSATVLCTIIRYTNDVIAQNGWSMWALHFEQLLGVSCVFAVFALYFGLLYITWKYFENLAGYFNRELSQTKVRLLATLATLPTCWFFTSVWAVGYYQVPNWLNQ